MSFLAKGLEDEKENDKSRGNDGWDKVFVWQNASGDDANDEKAKSAGGAEGEDAANDAERLGFFRSFLG